MRNYGLFLILIVFLTALGSCKTKVQYDKIVYQVDGTSASADITHLDIEGKLISYTKGAAVYSQPYTTPRDGRGVSVFLNANNTGAGFIRVTVIVNDMIFDQKTGQNVTIQGTFIQ